MNQNDKDLYYACVNFCNAFFHLMCAKEEYYNRRIFRDPYEDDFKRRLEFEEDRLKNSFDRLCETVDKVKK